MPGQPRVQIRTRALLTIALLTPNQQQDRGPAEAAVVQNLQLPMVMWQLHRATTIRIRMKIHKRKLIDHLQDKVYRKGLSLSLL